MVSYKKIPKMVVTVSSEDLLEGIDGKPVTVTLTIESIYNLPDVMTDDNKSFEVCFGLPIYAVRMYTKY